MSVVEGNIPTKAGKSTKRMESKQRSSIVWVIIFVLIAGLIINLLLNNSTKLEISGIVVLGLILLLSLVFNLGEFKINKIDKEARKWDRGAQAEEVVGGLLDNLSGNYYVNDVRSPFGNINHVVIGEYAGIILIETKSHHGKVIIENGILLINGEKPEKNFLSQTLTNCCWLRVSINERFGIKPWITPILVFTNAFVPFMPPYLGVMLMNKKFLISIIDKIQNRNAVNRQIWDKRVEIEGMLTQTA